VPLPSEAEIKMRADALMAKIASHPSTLQQDIAAAKAALPEHLPRIMAGRDREMEAARDILYSTSHYLYESPVFLPYMMAHGDRDTAWKYVNRFEKALMSLVLTSIGGTILAQSEGYEPGYDLIIETDEGVQKVEVKSTERHHIFIEGGRYDMTASGLSLTESDVYLILSRDTKTHPDGTQTHTGKVRISFTYQLVEEYMRLAQHSELALRPNAHGPGSRGVKMDPKKDLPHIWIGDVACKVDEFGNTMYDLSKFIREPFMDLQARKEYNQGVRLMEKLDVRPEEKE
jgi:hypothetical protein